MSLILDALARSEQEKRQREKDAPDLLTPDLNAAPSSRRPWLVPGLAALVVLLLLLLLWVVLGSSRKNQTEPTVSAPGAAATLDPIQREALDESPEVSGAPNLQNRGEMTEANLPGRVDTSARDFIADAAGPTPTPTPTRAANSGSAANSVPAQDAAPTTTAGAEDRRASPSGVIAALYRDNSTADTTAETTSPAQTRASEPPESRGDAALSIATQESVGDVIDLGRVLREVRAEQAAGELEAHPVALLAEQSKQFRDSVPTLMYLRHDYQGSGPSTVTINGQVLAVGGRTRGVEVREILKDSAILRFQGTEFRLRALNSWVNL